MGDVEVHTRVAQFGHETNVALDKVRLGFRGHSAQAELERGGSGVHAAALREARVFSMLNHAEPYARGGGEGFAHDAVFEDGPAIVGDGDGSGGLQSGEVVKRLAF